MRLPRMTIRRWMMTVILATAFITVAQIGERWRKFQNLAVWHQKQAGSFATAAVRPRPVINVSAIDTTAEDFLREIEETKRTWNYYLGRNTGFRMTRSLVSAEDVRRAEEELKQAEAEIEKLSVWVRAFVDYHREMSRKYRRAASRPWVRVDPDPPPLEP